jgi:hypothetical protein
MSKECSAEELKEVRDALKDAVYDAMLRHDFHRSPSFFLDEFVETMRNVARDAAEGIRARGLEARCYTRLRGSSHEPRNFAEVWCLVRKPGREEVSLEARVPIDFTIDFDVRLPKPRVSISHFPRSEEYIEVWMEVL